MITQPTVNDIDKLLDLWEVAVDEIYPLMSYDRILHARRTLKGEIQLLPTVRILRNEKGKIVALIKVDDGVITFLYVHPTERKKGYATLLIDYALKHVDIKGVKLRKPTSYILSFYEKAGFKPEDEAHKYGQKVYLVYRPEDAPQKKEPA